MNRKIENSDERWSNILEVIRDVLLFLLGIGALVGGAFIGYLKQKSEGKR